MSLILFFIMDPFGNLSTFLDLMRDLPPKSQRWIIAREMVIALAVMIFFSLVGEPLIHFLNVSTEAVQITSGLVLFLAALGILFPNKGNIRTNIPTNHEPFVVPIAIPLIAGPSLLTTIMLFSHLDTTVHLLPLAVFFAWGASIIILLFSRQLFQLLGANGLRAIERLIAIVMILIGIQRVLEGIKMIVESLKVS